MFYVSAIIAIVGAVGYQYFVKHIPASLNPIVSVIGIYIAVLILSERKTVPGELDNPA